MKAFTVFVLLTLLTAMVVGKATTYYEILGLSQNADEVEVRKAYKELARKWHPDRFVKDEEAKKHAEAMFRDIQEAYEVLSNPDEKAAYDRMGHNKYKQKGKGFNFQGVNFDFSGFSFEFDDFLNDSNPWVVFDGVVLATSVFFFAGLFSFICMYSTFKMMVWFFQPLLELGHGLVGIVAVLLLGVVGRWSLALLFFQCIFLYYWLVHRLLLKKKDIHFNWFSKKAKSATKTD